MPKDSDHVARLVSEAICKVELDVDFKPVPKSPLYRVLEYRGLELVGAQPEGWGSGHKAHLVCDGSTIETTRHRDLNKAIDGFFERLEKRTVEAQLKKMRGNG